MLEEGTIVKLGGLYEYVVVFSTMFDDSNYVFVTNVDFPDDSCFYKNNNDGRLELVKDMYIILALTSLYKKRLENESNTSVNK